MNTSAKLIDAVSCGLSNARMDDISAVRRANLWLLSAHFSGPSELARQLERSPSQVSQYLNALRRTKGGKNAKIGDRFARHVEARLRLQHGWMDHKQVAVPTTVSQPAGGIVSDVVSPYRVQREQSPSSLFPSVSWDELRALPESAKQQLDAFARFLVDQHGPAKHKKTMVLSDQALVSATVYSFQDFVQRRGTP